MARDYQTKVESENNVYAHEPAALLDKRDETDGGVSGRARPETPKPGEERDMLLGEAVC